MTRFRSVLLASMLGVATGVASTSAHAATAPAATEEAKKLYEEGKTAYKLGDFGVAIQKFEQAYAMTENPIILYNVGLAYERLYTTSNDVAHLRKSQAVLENYLSELLKDPEIGHDPAEVERQIGEIKSRLEAHDSRPNDGGEGGGEGGNGGETTAGGGDSGPGPGDDLPPSGEDPGKKPRLIGMILMGAGGAAAAGGIGAGVAMGLRGQAFEDELVNSYAASEADGCSSAAVSSTCAALLDQQDRIRSNGKLANSLALGLGAGLTTVGIGVAAAGAVLFMGGQKKTKAWKGGEVSVLPTPGGLLVQGRF